MPAPAPAPTAAKTETLYLRFVSDNFLARRELLPKQPGFFEHRSLEENADGNNTKMWSAPAAGNLPRDCIRNWGFRMAAIVCAQHHVDRTIHDSFGYSCSYTWRRRDDIAITEGRRDIYEF